MLYDLGVNRTSWARETFRTRTTTRGAVVTMARRGMGSFHFLWRILWILHKLSST